MAKQELLLFQKDVVFNNVEDWSDNKESKDRHDQKCHERCHQEVHDIWNNLADSFFSNLAPTTPMMKAGRTEPCKPTTGMKPKKFIAVTSPPDATPKRLEVSQKQASYQGRYQQLGYHQIRGRLTIQLNLAR